MGCDNSSFSGPIVEHRLHLLDLFARELSTPRALEKELAQQAIGVLIRTPLQGRCGCAT